jgi:hypothetical protein
MTGFRDITNRVKFEKARMLVSAHEVCRIVSMSAVLHAYTSVAQVKCVSCSITDFPWRNGEQSYKKKQLKRHACDPDLYHARDDILWNLG